MTCPKCNLVIYTGARAAPGADGFTLVDRGKEGKKYHQTTIGEMVVKFNRYWIDQYKLHINFTFGEDDYPFITLTEAAMLRNELLRKKMDSMGLPENPVIVEPFAGCGADTITFLYDMKPQKIYVSEIDDKKSELLRKNLENFEQATKETHNLGKTMNYYVGLAKDIFENVIANSTDISLLYLDPPWVLHGIKGNEEGGEADAGQLLTYLKTNLFDPMRKRKLAPKLIVIKTRFGWEKLRGVMNELPQNNMDDPRPLYVHTDTIIFKPFRRNVHFHTLQTTDGTLHQWEHSEIQGRIYDKGKNKGGRGEGSLRYVQPLLN
jgi:hypothetical protein